MTDIEEEREAIFDLEHQNLFYFQIQVIDANPNIKNLSRKQFRHTSTLKRKIHLLFYNMNVQLQRWNPYSQVLARVHVLFGGQECSKEMCLQILDLIERRGIKIENLDIVRGFDEDADVTP